MSSTDKHAEVHEKVMLMLQSAPALEPLTALIDIFPHLDIYLAGGALRDALIGRSVPSKDLDFFLAGQNVDSAIARLEDSGELIPGPLGSPRWFPEPGSDFYCDVIPVTRFYNGLWRCRDIVDVLNQFDFTANAVALDLRSPRLHNPQNGIRDLTGRIMRAVRFDYPEEPVLPGAELSWAAMLWCRILHYAAALDFKIEPVTLAWLEDNRRFAAQARAFEKTIFPLHPQALGLLNMQNHG